MKSGYRIEWTDHALNELSETFEFVEKHWTEKELEKLSNKIEEILSLISMNPELFQISYAKKEIRRAVVTKHNSLYYRNKNETIEILSFFSNRKNPKELDLRL